MSKGDNLPFLHGHCLPRVGDAAFARNAREQAALAVEAIAIAGPQGQTQTAFHRKNVVVKSQKVLVSQAV
jgi:hypothetical protein